MLIALTIYSYLIHYFGTNDNNSGFQEDNVTYQPAYDWLFIYEKQCHLHIIKVKCLDCLWSGLTEIN